MAVFETRVSQGVDDAEQKIQSSRVNTTSSDLELVTESRQQFVGIRFRDLDIPVGAKITNAYLEFTTDEPSGGDVNLTIRAEDSGDVVAFDEKDVSSRELTEASAIWAPVPWNAVGDKHRATGLESVVQEVVLHEDWAPGNDLAFVIQGEENNTNKRVAESYNGEPGSAPLLHVEYEISFAVFGDYGIKGWDSDLAVSNLIKTKLDPSIIITLGDNAYTKKMYNLDKNNNRDFNEDDFKINNIIEPLYGDYISKNEKENRFFPIIGNHEVTDDDNNGNLLLRYDEDDITHLGVNAYLEYFHLPNGSAPENTIVPGGVKVSPSELYYQFRRGDVNFFALDTASYAAEAERGKWLDDQFLWLEQQLKASDAAWNIVYGHSPAYTSGVCVRSDRSDVGNLRLIVSILDDGHSEALYGEQERAEEAVLVG